MSIFAAINGNSPDQDYSMDIQTENKSRVILITGASSGIGAAAASALAARGDIVYGAARRASLIPEGVIPLSMDLTDAGSVHSGVDRGMADRGRIDILVNNAGYGYLGAIENVTMEEARRQLEVNLFGLAELTKAVVPHMRERESGRIVNIASVAGHAVMYFGGWYHVSKFAVVAFSDALRIELAPFGIHVITIEPGGVKTDWGGIAARHLAESSAGTPYEKDGSNMAALMEKGYSMNLLAKPEVVARSILKACNSPRPKPRYRPGTGASSIVFWHAALPDRWWDALMRQGGKIR